LNSAAQLKSQPTTADSPNRRGISFFRLLFWLLALLFFSVCYPPFFRFGVRQIAEYAAQRCGLRLEIAQVGGSLFEPVSIINTTLSTASFAGTEIHLRIARAEAAFSVENLLFHHGNGCLSKLSVDGMEGEIILSPEAPEDGESEPGRPIPRRLLPASIELRRVNLAVHEKDNLIFFQNIECDASDVNSGTVSVEKIHVAEPWLTKTFSDVRGTMALQNSRISVASVTLEKGIQIESASADLTELINRKLRMDFQISAFSGDIRGEIRGFTRENQNLNFEATGFFSNISIPQLADFLKSPEATGGTIQDGRFSFYGSLRDLKDARFSTRLSAGDFRWGQRQWNSLVLGAMMVDRHLQIPDLELRQAHNTLNLSGEIAIPDSLANWPQSDFNFNIDAKIDNVTELSLLFGPDFADTAGTAVLKGAISGHAMSYTGDLTVSGSNLSYKTVPVDTLHASVTLNGNELQVTSFELVHKNDFLRGKGGTNLFRDKKYWGELNASIVDLALYSALLRPPIVPQLYGGGLVIEWSGDGAANSHSGAFHAQLKNLRPLRETDPKSIPQNAELEGTYSPENIFFKKFSVSNALSSLTAVIAANTASLAIDSLQYKYDKEVRLAGSALLPFNLWRAWQHFDDACWNPAGECKLDLTATKLDLHEALMLTGREFPFQGELEGKLATSGSLADLNASGRIHFSKGQIAPAPGLSVFEADATLDGKNLTLEKSAGRFDSTDFAAGGEINFTDFHNPSLKLSVRSKAVPFELSRDLRAKADLDLKLDGPVASTRVTGTATLLAATFETKVNLYPLLLPGKHSGFEFNPQLSITRSPFDHWQIDVDCTAGQPLKTGDLSGTVRPDLRLSGSGGTFTTTGSLCFENMTVPAPFGTATIDEATLFLRQDHPDAPLLSGRFSAKIADHEISGYAFGALDEPGFLLVSNPPLPEPLILQLLTRGFAAKSADTPIPDFLAEMPLELQSPFLDDNTKSATLFLAAPDQGSGFAMPGASTDAENQEAATAEPAK
jgi:hypothetical protein